MRLSPFAIGVVDGSGDEGGTDDDSERDEDEDSGDNDNNSGGSGLSPAIAAGSSYYGLSPEQALGHLGERNGFFDIHVTWLPDSGQTITAASRSDDAVSLYSLRRPQVRIDWHATC